MTTYDEALHPRGQAGNAGQYREKRNDAPTAQLDGVQLPVFTPDDVRNTDHTIDIIREHILAGDRVSGFHELDSDTDGNTVVEWEWTSQYFGGNTTYRERATIDDRGEILTRQSQGPGGHWFAADMHGDEAAALRMKVNEARLAMAGVRIHGQANDGGPYGRKFVGGRVDQSNGGWANATNVSAAVRKQIAAAIEWGALPGEYDYRVKTSKFAGGQAIDIVVEGMPDSKHFAERQEGYAHGSSAHVREVTQVLELIGNQWNTDASDLMTDYFDVTYYLNVQVDDERMAEFRAKQREIAAAKRRAKKDAVKGAAA